MTHGHTSATLISFVVMMTLGCDGSNGPATGPTTGAIHITVSTEGKSGDLDTDGYGVTVDGRAPEAIGVQGALTIADLAPGSHLVSLLGLAANCSVLGTNPRSVDVITGDKTAAPVTVAFSVSCIGTGSIQVTIVTTGDDFDTDGYSVSIDGGASRPVGVNAGVTIGELASGSHGVLLEGVARNCSVSGANPRSVSVIKGDNSASAVVVTFSVSCTAEEHPSGSPSSEKLAFMRATGSGQLQSWQIYAVSVSGGISSPLTALPGNAFTPAWSPDGSQIAFATDRDGNTEIYVMNRDGSNPVRLTSSVGLDTRPAWSPDGARIAFTSGRTGKHGIYIMNADGTDPVRLSSESSYSDGEPNWSPDGTRIAFSSGGEIRVMNVDGSGQNSLTTGHSDQSPQWSPGGTRIAFSRNMSDGGAILIMNADGSNVTRLTSDVNSAQDPTWSSDGRRIAFSGRLYVECDNDYWSPPCPEYPTSIFVVGVDGTRYPSPIVLDASSPAWSRR